MSPVPPGTAEAQKVEEQRQVQLLCDGFDAALEKHSADLLADGAAPMLNAVFGALASHLARALSAIEKPAHRRMMREAFDRAVLKGMNDPRNVASRKATTFIVRPRGSLS